MHKTPPRARSKIVPNPTRVVVTDGSGSSPNIPKISSFCYLDSLPIYSQSSDCDRRDEVAPNLIRDVYIRPPLVHFGQTLKILSLVPSILLAAAAPVSTFLGIAPDPFHPTRSHRPPPSFSASNQPQAPRSTPRPSPRAPPCRAPPRARGHASFARSPPAQATSSLDPDWIV